MPFEATDPPIPLTSEHGDYDEVRGVLLLGLTSTKLPDSIIALSVHQGKAEDDVRARVPNAEERLGNARVRRAAIYLTAALLCPSMTQIIKAEANDAMSYEVNRIDWLAKKDWLNGLADAEISAVLAEDEEPRAMRPIVHFMRAPGGRGKW